MTESAFDQAIAVSFDGNRAYASTHPKFHNMVGPFGGITVATISHAVQTHPDAQGRLAAITTNFTSPLSEGDYELELECVRTNSSNQHWVVKGHQGENTPLTATVLLVAERGQLRANEIPFPSVGAPEEYPVADGEGRPEWSNNYELRFVEGGWEQVAEGPQEDTTSTYWLRHADGRPWDYAALVSASDTFFPRSFLRAGQWLPAGTITITTYVSADAHVLESAGTDILCSARAQWFGSGLHDQTAQLWTQSGEVLAVSHQLVYSKL